MKNKFVSVPKDPYDVNAWNSFYQQNPTWKRGVGADGDNEGDNEGDQDEDKNVDPASYKKQIDALKATNANLKNEKKTFKEKIDQLAKIQETFQSLGGEDGIKRLTEYQRKIQTDEMSALLADGKVEEWFEKRTDGLRKNHTNELTKREELLKKNEERAVKAEQKLQRIQIDIGVREAARKTEGFEDSAIPDAVLLASNVFSFDAELDMPVMRDEDGGIVYGNDAKTPKSIGEWLLELQDSRPHWWGGSKGSGARGGKGKQGAELTLEQKLAKNMLTMDEYRAERKKLNFKNF